jgi:hypothetical protein
MQAFYLKGRSLDLDIIAKEEDGRKKNKGRKVK